MIRTITTTYASLEVGGNEDIGASSMHLPSVLTIDLNQILSDILIEYDDIQYSQLYTRIDYVELRQTNKEHLASSFYTLYDVDQVRCLINTTITQEILNRKTNET